MRQPKNKPTKEKVLFILKLRHLYGAVGVELKSAGLSNSAQYVADMLVKNGIESKVVQVVDNNDIDREVSAYQPTTVIIEALWVVPAKFEVLKKLHPNVRWIIRLHSEIPFLANEGIAMDWINDYIVQDNVFVSFNSWETHKDFVEYFRAVNPALLDKLIYLPNYYPVLKKQTKEPRYINVLNVGCFGAIRPMKNHLVQAAAAVEFCEMVGLRCRFHVNAGRVENRGDTILKNLREFFAPFNGKHELVEHGWLDRDDFLKLVNKMDIGLQVSMSETFNIVSADFVSQNVPMVTSKEVDWMPKIFCATPTSVNEIVFKMYITLKFRFLWSILDLQRRALKQYVNTTERIWMKEFCKKKH